MSEQDNAIDLIQSSNKAREYENKKKKIVKMILSDQYITKDMFIKDSYKGNNYANNNAVMFDLQNGKQNVLCLCANRHIAEAIAEALNLLDNLESSGAELYKHEGK